MTQLRANGDQIAENRRARFDYEIVDTLEAGLILTGSEVKSLRHGHGALTGAFAAIDRDGLPKIFGMQIDPYLKSGAHLQHEPKRPRILLLKQKELKKIAVALERGGMTLVPLKLYFTKKGKVKLLLAVARGKKTVDKRDAVKQRDWKRDQARELRGRNT